MLRRITVRKGPLAVAAIVAACVIGPLAEGPSRFLSYADPAVAEMKEKQADKTNATDDAYMYLGAASCSGSACHGSTTPRNKLKIAQNEFFIWSEKDAHTKAYEVLTKPDAKVIAKNLRIPKAEESDRCLVCHAVSVAPERQGSLYEITEGISCEGCHGAAERWLGPHIRKDFDMQKGIQIGMYPTKDFGKRTEKCLGCHAGADAKVVDHELIGAGHPRLKFELDVYSSKMPAHWRPPKEKQAADWLGARAWAIGQAGAFRNEMKMLTASRRSRVGIWPDLTHFDCFACHHPVVDHLKGLTEQQKNEQRWRFRDYEGKPGRLVWNAASYSILRHLISQVSPDEAKTLDQLVKVFHEGVAGKGVSAETFGATLTRLSDLSDKLVSTVSQQTFNQPLVVSLMRNISGDGKRLAAAGFQSAEQAVLTVASLYDAYKDAAGPPPDHAAVMEAIDGLYKTIQDTRTFHAADFEGGMNKVHKLFQKLGSASASPS
jgi:hypothetical protein